ncbi:NAD(P)/FAD-dependent oxidoreductase [Sphingobacterium sp. SGG-5]|uniref:phytoene desaturase family protein n=1 Tax=Sphingobacterium sp. SGG-5 TaxID=2710881 RepID=UPI0013EA9495|nr:NAD(P)/FAD-dependent oxidoreductase [Sphingobacterium sp. SGG-5]NGM60742.1 NAD(P)/FAD-dependent oxidoreductase [Sphingobacterium sp. SGG-5]
MSLKISYDAIIIGSGPNGLAAGITLQQRGLSTLIIEGADTIGGGMRTKELTLPDFKHDVCSAIHPMAVASPFMRSLPLQEYGLEFVQAPYAAAHPLDSGDVALLTHSLAETADGLGIDGDFYKKLIQPVVNHWESLAQDIMGPLHFPKRPLQLADFGLDALRPASWLARSFKTEKGKALWAGMVAHGIQPLSNWATSAIGMVLMAVGNKYGWPIPIGGSQSIGEALVNYYKDLGGEVQTGLWVKNVADLPNYKTMILDLTPRQILQLDGLDLTESYRRELQKYRQGMGVFKIDWALSEPVPFKDPRCGQAATVHIGNTYEDIARAERETHRGELIDKPFVLFAQQSVFDSGRAPAGKHTSWAYCHVPNGSTADRTEAIENQIERFAPGFKDIILERHTINAQQMEVYNPNYVGGDINGGIMDIGQLFTRPTRSLTPYRTANKKVYICSSSTPPGGGVHGMCGYHAARTVLADWFHQEIEL